MSSNQNIESAVSESILARFLSLAESYNKLVSLNVGELVFQRFFQKYPIFLEPSIKFSYPQMSFGAEKFPDFVLLLANFTYVLVEIEKPGVRLFTKKGEPTAILTHAQQQIREYLEWSITERDFLIKRLCPKINAHNVKGLIVIGRTEGLSDKDKRRLELINSEIRGKYEIKTFDQLSMDLSVIANNFLPLLG
jgi:hypothetical protein